MSDTSVERVDYRQLDRFYSEHYAANEPAVITGVPDAHALNIFQYSPEYLEAALGERAFPVLSTDSQFLSYERDSQPMPFAEFVSRAFRQEPNGRQYYFKNPTKLLPDALDDSEKISGLASFFSDCIMRNLWISRGTITVGLHFDAAENLNIQIRGRKRFTLFPPGTSRYYPCPMFSQTAHMSRVFREGPELDHRRFPKFDPSRGREVVLEEGEILYLPAYWWHQVTSLGDVNINLNTWWWPRRRKQLRHWNQALRGYAQLALRYLAFGNIVSAPKSSVSGPQNTATGQ